MIQKPKAKSQKHRSKFKNLIYFGFLIVIFNFSFLIFHLDKAEASALSLSIDPAIIEIHALPPAVTTSTLSIQNKSDAEIQLRILLKSFKPNGENGELEYVGSQDSFLTQNTQILDGGVPVEGIVLGPRQQKNLTLNVNVPRDTNSSDHYFSIIFVSQATANPTSTSSLNQLGIASNVLLSVGAKEMPDGVIEEFSSGLFYESGPVPFTLRIKNKGTHFIEPKGQILIKNMFGQSIGKLDLTRINILSDSIRAIPNATYVQELRSDSKKKSDLTFQNPKALWNEGFLLGFYTATLNISLSDDGPAFTKSIHFLALPLVAIIVIVIVLISTIVIVTRVKMRMKK